jgi:hypothetical protein
VSIYACSKYETTNVKVYVTDTHLADRDLRAARQLFLAPYAIISFHPPPPPPPRTKFVNCFHVLNHLMDRDNHIYHLINTKTLNIWQRLFSKYHYQYRQFVFKYPVKLHSGMEVNAKGCRDPIL